MEALMERLRKWHMLKEKHHDLAMKKERMGIEKKVEDIKRNKDIPKLLETLVSHPGKCGDLHEFLKQEFVISVKFNLKERISCIIECMSIAKSDFCESREILLAHLRSLYSKVAEANISTRLATLVNFQEYDSTDGLGISEYIRDRLEEETDGYLRNPPTNPKELDGWLSEAVKISRYNPKVAEKYKDLETEYFSVCFDLIKIGSREDVVEDAIYLINKIRKRSGMVGVDLSDELKKKLDKHGLLEEEEVREFFNALFPSLE